MKKQKISDDLLNMMEDMGFDTESNSENISWDDLIFWLEYDQKIGVELVLDPQKKWIWRVTPLTDECKFNEQMLSDRLHEDRYSSIDHAIREISKFMKSS